MSRSIRSRLLLVFVAGLAILVAWALLAPIGPADAASMIAELRGAAILSGARGRAPADRGALADAIVRLAALAEAHRPSLRALDLNPLLVLDDGRGVVAVDWLIEFA